MLHHLQSVVSEACSFFQYANSILNEFALSDIRGADHFEMYLQRIALSVMLPPPPSSHSDDHVIPSNLEGAATPLLAMRGDRARKLAAPSELIKTEKSSTLPAKKGNVLLPAVQRIQRSLGERTRSGSLNLPSEGAAAVKPKAMFKKQRSLHSDIGRGRDPPAGSETLTDPRRSDASSDKAEESEPGAQWRGLQLDLLRGRIQRLVVLLNTSVPGTVPDPNMLASLIDLVRIYSVCRPLCVHFKLLMTFWSYLYYKWVKLSKFGSFANYELNLPSDRVDSELSENHKIIEIRPTELKLWPSEHNTRHNYKHVRIRLHSIAFIHNHSEELYRQYITCTSI